MPLNLDRLEEIKIVDSNGDELAIDGSGYITANINGTVTVTASDLDIRDLVYTSDSVTAHQGGTWTIDSITNDVSIDDGGNSITVDASDLDIRDLDSSQDSVEIKTAAGQALAIDGSGYLTVNQGTSPWVVSATDLDIRDLANATDYVAIGDESNLVDLEIADAVFGAGYGFSMYGVRQDAAGSPVSADGDAHPFVFNNNGQLKVAGDINVTEDSYDSIATQTATVGTSAVELASTPLSNRKNIIIQNLGASDIYVGEDNSVTTSSGLLVSKKSNLEFKCSASCDVWAISANAGNDVRILEMAD